MSLFKKSPNRICHDILKFLYEESIKANGEELIGSISISNATSINIGQIHDMLIILQVNGDIALMNLDRERTMKIEQKGIASYLSKKYLNDEWQRFWDKHFAWGRFVIPLLAAILSAIIAINVSSRNSNIRFENLEKRISEIEKHSKITK
jgi:hypothetical protein